MTRKLYVAMCGLPARGKSTLARRIREGLEAEGRKVAIFNNGDLRRTQLGGASSDPSFYHPDNEEGRRQREYIARENMEHARAWLQAGGDVAILDATNVSRARRAIMEDVLTDYPLLFVESVNDDPVLLETGIERKTLLPEFSRASKAEAVASFRKRIAYYDRIYTPLGDERNWVRVDRVENRIVSESLSETVPYYPTIRDILVADWVRNLYLVRHGETEYNLVGRIGGDPALTGKGREQARSLAAHFRRTELPCIFTSTRQRSHQTAAPLCDSRPDSLCMAMPEFDEINAGRCENMRYSEILEAMPDEYAARHRDKFNYAYPGGEGYALLQERVRRGLRRALFLAGDASAMVIVGHQAINRCILSHFLFRRTEDVPYIYIPQNQYYHIVSTQRKKLFELVRFM